MSINQTSLINKIKKYLPVGISDKLPKEIKLIWLNSTSSRKLNLIYRGCNKPTNILSFLYGPEYGEILICPEIVKKEAKIRRNSQEFQMTWMILHGMLHLAGRHHEKSPSAEKKFEREEGLILHKIFAR